MEETMKISIIMLVLTGVLISCSTIPQYVPVTNNQQITELNGESFVIILKDSLEVFANVKMKFSSPMSKKILYTDIILRNQKNSKITISSKNFKCYDLNNESELTLLMKDEYIEVIEEFKKILSEDGKKEWEKKRSKGVYLEEYSLFPDDRFDCFIAFELNDTIPEQIKIEFNFEGQMYESLFK